MENVEDIYPLSPLQESLLGHALSSGSAAGFEQTTFFLKGDLDVEAFRRTWQRIVDRHTVLRTAFVHRGLDEPLQVVRRQVTLPFELHDWRHLAAEEQRGELETLLRADHERGFNLERPPLMRVILVRLDPSTHLFVWSHHHLVLDGWCRSLIQREVATLFAAFREGKEPRLAPSRPFRDYIEWLQHQDRSRALEFWRRHLEGLEGPTPLVVDRLPRGDAEGGANGPERRDARRELAVPATVVEDLKSFARRSKVTPSTIAQAAWALLLSRYNNREDVLFGIAVSGRPPDLPQVESIMGMFVNNLPVRIRVRSRSPVLPWLLEIQALLLKIRRFDFVSPSQVQEASGMGQGSRLFESFLLFQNYPVGVFSGADVKGGAGESADPSGDRTDADVSAELYHVRLETNYPLTVVVVPRQTWSLRIFFDEGRFSTTAIDRMLGHFRNLLEGLISPSTGNVGGLAILSAAERHQLMVEPRGGHHDRAAAAVLDRFLDRPAAGAGIEGSRIYVLDRRLAPQPIGVPGEVWLGGSMPAPGPSDRPAHTADRCRPDPFSTLPSARLLRTAVLARWLHRGELELLGRVDERGAMKSGEVQMGEVETVLKRHSDIREAVVTHCHEPDGSTRLIAYLSLRRGHRLDPAGLRSYLRRTLPQHMVPSAFAVPESLPLTPEGRIDRDRLPSPEALGAALHEALAPPRTPLELRLLQIWEDLFDVRGLGVTDDFFALGGHSLLALNLRARIRSDLGKDLTLTQLLGSPTIHGLAGTLEKEADACPESSLVAIRRGGSRPPLFAVHPAGGGVLCYVALAHKLGAEQPIYGLQAPGWQDTRTPVASVEELASRYLAEIRGVQPRGPYRLLGWSFGGFVVYEMACRLVEAGDEVSLLAILDSGISRKSRPEQDDIGFLSSVLGADVSVPEADLRAIGDYGRQIEYLAAQAREENRLPADFDLDHAKRLLEVWRSHRKAARTFRPRLYPGRLVLVRCAESAARAGADPTMGWRELAQGGVDVRDVPGRHRDLMTHPDVRAVARELQGCLERSAREEL